jgi:DNA-binding CsgD family transcriptional regulator
MTVAEVGLLSCEEVQAPVRVGWTPVSGRRLRPSSLRGALAAVVTGGHVDIPVRTEIVDSWRRAVAGGLRPADIEAPPDDPPREEGPLDWVGAMVVASVAEDLAGTHSTVILADDRGRIVRRCAADPRALSDLDRINMAPGFTWSEPQVGTNGVGTTLHRRVPTFVVGDEHFADAFTAFSSAAAPIMHAGSDRVSGVISISDRAHEATALMMTVARQAARDVERGLRALQSDRQRRLQDCFVRARRRVRGALALVAADTLLTNAAAATILEADDRAVLWACASHGVDFGTPARGRGPFEVRLASGRSVLVTCEPVHDGTALVGALLRIDPRPELADGPTTRQPTARAEARFGWASLTPTELVVTERVAGGYTKRAIAAQLYMSPHTVDSHIRHIYCKLGITSRIELARLMMSDQQRSSGTLGASPRSTP